MITSTRYRVCEISESSFSIIIHSFTTISTHVVISPHKQTLPLHNVRKLHCARYSKKVLIPATIPANSWQVLCGRDKNEYSTKWIY